MNDPNRDPNIERRGVLAAIVLRGGDGHLLGLPDPKLVVNGEIQRSPCDVPMKYTYGDVVLVDVNAKGRDVQILGKEIRIVNQIDILSHIEGIKMQKNDAGEWEQVEE